MIYTCTLNPSLDYYMEFDQKLQMGKYNRSQLEYYEAGGKGINVSIVLNNLLIPSKAIGFLGGFPRDLYISLLQKYEYIQPNFTYIEGHTRINVKMHAEKDTDFNAAGPYITDKEMKALMEKVKRLDDTDYLVFSGHCQEYLMEDTQAMLEDCMDRKVKVVLDTNLSLTKKLLKKHPFLVKTTREELVQETGKPLETVSEILEEAKAFHEQGASNVMILMNHQEAILVSDQACYQCDIQQTEKAVNTVGTGDSMVAGFIMNYIRTSDVADSFRFASCCGSATAYSKGLATREKIDSFYEKRTIQKL